MNDNNEQELPLGLYWKGKRTTVDRIVLPFQSLEIIETINESRATREKEKGTMFRQDPNVMDVEWRNKLIWGDNKYVMSALLEKHAGKIDLIYIDPPFGTGLNFSNIENDLAYSDKLVNSEFLEFIRKRLFLLREFMSENGSIYLHIDKKIGHYVKIIMDEVFGYENFINDITRIKCNPKNFSRNAYGNYSDMILFYAKFFAK